MNEEQKQHQVLSVQQDCDSTAAMLLFGAFSFWGPLRRQMRLEPWIDVICQSLERPLT